MFIIARQPNAWRDAVVALAADYEAGVVPGWPNAYSNQAVEGVRYMLAESRACQAQLMAKVGD